MEKFSAIVFDLGNVIFDVSFDNIFNSWAKVSGVPGEDIKRKFKFGKGKVVRDFSKGKISSGTFRRQLSEELGFHMPDSLFDKGWNSIFLEKRSGIDEILETLHGKYRLIALSNTNEIHHAECKRRYREQLKHFEQIFCSHEIHAYKPEQKAYDAVIRFLQLPPSNILFLDDGKSNVLGAKKSGMKTIHVRSATQMREQLRAKQVLQ